VEATRRIVDKSWVRRESDRCRWCFLGSRDSERLIRESRSSSSMNQGSRHTACGPQSHRSHQGPERKVAVRGMTRGIVRTPIGKGDSREHGPCRALAGAEEPDGHEWGVAFEYPSKTPELVVFEGVRT